MAVLRRDPDWIAPILWRSEFRSVLSLLMRRHDFDLETAIELADLAESLLRGREYILATPEVLRLAANSRCSVYDCEFVALARQERIPLVTSDRMLLQSFPDLAVTPERFASGA